ncbi:hypothetical protein BDF22DRAFT_665057 [Syncephalis plumigaleata]|nr:hypothetical protein BDF22DRAFT_665057 [Syncephalis plumigaleata]
MQALSAKVSLITLLALVAVAGMSMHNTVDAAPSGKEDSDGMVSKVGVFSHGLIEDDQVKSNYEKLELAKRSQFDSNAGRYALPGSLSHVAIQKRSTEDSEQAVLDMRHISMPKDNHIPEEFKELDRAAGH